MDTLSELLQRARGILFDFDGVLVDSEAVHFATFQGILAEHDHVLVEADYWMYWTVLGEGIRGEIRRHGLSHLDPDALQEEKDRKYLEACGSGVIPFDPQARPLVQALKASGKIVSIASNSPREQIDAIRGAADPETVPLFDEIIGRHPGLAKKPAPDIFLAAAEAIGLPPADCLVIEDADKGLRASQAAGIPCIILRTPQNREFDFAGQDAIVGSLGEIREALERVSATDSL